MANKAPEIWFAQWRVWFTDTSCIAVNYHDGEFHLPMYPVPFKDLPSAIEFAEALKRERAVKKQVAQYRMVCGDRSGTIARNFDGTFTAWCDDSPMETVVDSYQTAHIWLREALNDDADADTAVNDNPPSVFATDRVLATLERYAEEAHNIYEGQCAADKYTWFGLLAACVMAVDEVRPEN